MTQQQGLTLLNFVAPAEGRKLTSGESAAAARVQDSSASASAAATPIRGMARRMCAVLLSWAD